MNKGEKNRIDRRWFLKRIGTGTAISTVALTGCDSRNNAVTGNRSATGEVSADGMTYRTHPVNGDKVSLLGYGCMRWPLKPNPSGEGEVIDQDAVNELVDYALAHG